MAKTTKNKPVKTTKNKPSNQENKPSVRLVKQYIKDLSFENMATDQVAENKKPSVDIDLNIDIKTEQHSDDNYETCLSVTAKAHTEKDTVFIIELSYSGIFKLQNLPEDAYDVVLNIDAPNLLFPFLRRILSDVTRDANLPPLMLDPINFAAIHAAKQESAEKPS